TPADLQALYEIMLPVNKQYKPILPSDSDEPGEDARAFDTVASAPGAAKPYFEQFQANSIESYENERILATEGGTKYQKKLEDEKNFFDIYVQRKFPSYYKIIEEYKEMCDEKKREQELNASEAQ
ncbi:unnamed protein product, partial [Prorocentrum cordatum]